CVSCLTFLSLLHFASLFFSFDCLHRDLHSFPTRRSSDLYILRNCLIICNKCQGYFLLVKFLQTFIPYFLTFFQIIFCIWFHCCCKDLVYSGILSYNRSN